MEIWDSECSALVVANATSRICKAKTGSYTLMLVSYSRWPEYDYWQVYSDGTYFRVKPEELDAYI